MAERWSISWRPKKFSEVLGQQHVIAFFQIILEDHYRDGKCLPVGALFSGYSGVGKTTLARIIASSLNCNNRTGVEPCGVCDSCVSIVSGQGSILELDASFFGLVDNVRALRNRLYLYSLNKHQVVIIDECHMMSKEAFNVLLKMLEEPPPFVFFILITTEAERVLDTVRSRLLEFAFRHVPWEEVDAYLTRCLKIEKVECAPELYRGIYYLSHSNLRETIVSLEQLATLGKGKITAELVAEVCGDISLFGRLTSALLAGDFEEAIGCYESFIMSQPDIRVFLDGLSDYLSERLVKALRNSEVISAPLGLFLRTLFTFRSSPVSLQSLSSVKILLHELCSLSPRTAPRSSDSKVLTPAEIINILTKQ